jgi:hypothetical protein
MNEDEILRRLDRIEDRLAALTRRVYDLERMQPGAAPPPRREGPPSGYLPPMAPPALPPRPTPAFTAPPAPARPGEDWETRLGGNWLNKAGVLVLVIGIALALGYSYARMGPGGRVAIGLLLSFAMLGGGMAIEPREPYRTFARGLLGGGWAALYFTVYAMQALDAARVVYNPFAGAFLLLGVAAGMVLHSLRYRSQTVSGLAYFLAFLALAITQVTWLSVVVLVPLAASLLYLARRFGWSNMAVLGAAATYVTCASRGDTGAPLGQAMALFSVYWLLFEGFDLLRPTAWLLPLNAIGFLGLAIPKWHTAAPDDLWILTAASGAVYLAGGVLRARLHPEAKPLAGAWHGAATLTAALWAVALFQKADYHWLLAALAVEAELFYLAGLRFRARYLRVLAAGVFGIQALHLCLVELLQDPKELWIPEAALNAALFYGNRALRTADAFYGYAGAAMLALIAGYEAPGRYVTVAWGGLGIALLASGFPLRDRVLRVSGLGLLLICIGKLFLWDLRHLDTLPRIVSFLVLGGLLVGVSWIYTRFRERVRRYL